MFAELAFTALAIEAAFGFPDTLYRRIGHPVGWIGALIARCDRAWNRHEFSLGRRRLLGLGTLLLLLFVSGLAGMIISLLAQDFLAWLASTLVCGALASTLLAQRSLDAHVRAVAEALEQKGIEAGRHAVSMIVGRDTASLDEAGISRAAIESLAENFSDGVVAPLFWLLVAGLPGIFSYKAINTADSMIGHRTPRHEAFGWAAARLDDLVNLPAARLAALLIVAAAALTAGASAPNAWRALRRDAYRHHSPNAGYPEAAMAGALGLALAGPRVYGGVPVDDATMGSGRRDAGPQDIRAALALYRRADLIFVVLVAALSAAVIALI